jgi:signal transduction histidine kinase
MTKSDEIPAPVAAAPPQYESAAELLVHVVQSLSHARDLNTVTDIVRKAARRLTGADGATFVLREADKCHYADEDAISPLWKGQRFPINACISGWVMQNAQPAVIEDIYQDSRIPADLYRPTFVKSLAMVPIRKEAPIGAIGNYWAEKRRPAPDEIAVLQALADVTSVTMENIELYRRLQEKMHALEHSNEELSRFAWSAAHDLKSPLRAIDTIVRWIEDDLDGVLKADTRENMDMLHRRVRRMGKLLDDLLEYSHLERHLDPEQTDKVRGDTLIENVLALTYIPPGFRVNISGGFDSIRVPAIPLQRILCNLVNNAVTHHDRETGVIEISVDEQQTRYVFGVKDDGPGIRPEYRQRIFEMFQTLQSRDRTEGSGMGLAIVHKILRLYAGQIDVEACADRGTIFRFTWPKKPQYSMQPDEQG